LHQTPRARHRKPALQVAGGMFAWRDAQSNANCCSSNGAGCDFYPVLPGCVAVLTLRFWGFRPVAWRCRRD
jgi:hypothetical protein